MREFFPAPIMTGRKCAKKFRETASLERKKVHEKKEVAMKEDKKPKKKKKAGDVLLTVVLIAAIGLDAFRNRKTH